MVSRAKPVVNESTQHVNRNLAIVGAMLALVVVSWLAVRPQSGVVRGGAGTASTSPAEPLWWAAPDRAAAAQAPATAGITATEAAFRDYVDGKYRYLFEDATRAPQDRAPLRAALLERERVAVEINTARQSSDAAAKEALPGKLAMLAELDRKIGALLPPGELATYDVLKDSDIEQFQLDDYAGGIANVAPLSDSDKQSILYTKLVYRQRFRQALNESGLMRGDLSAAERQVVFAGVSRALADYQTSYLQEVRQYLYDDEQYTLLSNYENSEYTAELAKLKAIADGP